MCLNEAFTQEGKTRKGLLYTYDFRCTSCQALWRVSPNERYANVYEITLLEKGVNPRDLDLVPVGEVGDQQFWDSIRENQPNIRTPLMCMYVLRVVTSTSTSRMTRVSSRIS
jgi:hypothetical protein